MTRRGGRSAECRVSSAEGKRSDERRVTSDEEGRKKCRVQSAECRVPSAEGKRGDGQRGTRGERRGSGDRVGRLTGSDE